MDIIKRLERDPQDAELAGQALRHYARINDHAGMITLAGRVPDEEWSPQMIVACAGHCYEQTLRTEASLIQAIISRLWVSLHNRETYASCGSETVRLQILSAQTGLDVLSAWPAIEALRKRVNGRLRARAVDRGDIRSAIREACITRERFGHSGCERFPSSYDWTATGAGVIAGRRARQRCMYVGIARDSDKRLLKPWGAWRAFVGHRETPRGEVDWRANAMNLLQWTQEIDAGQHGENTIRIKQLRRG